MIPLPRDARAFGSAGRRIASVATVAFGVAVAGTVHLSLSVCERIAPGAVTEYLFGLQIVGSTAIFLLICDLLGAMLDDHAPRIVGLRVMGVGVRQVRRAWLAEAMLIGILAAIVGVTCTLWVVPFLLLRSLPHGASDSVVTLLVACQPGAMLLAGLLGVGTSIAAVALSSTGAGKEAIPRRPARTVVALGIAFGYAVLSSAMAARLRVSDPADAGDLVLRLVAVGSFSIPFFGTLEAAAVTGLRRRQALRVARVLGASRGRLVRMACAELVLVASLAVAVATTVGIGLAGLSGLGDVSPRRAFAGSSTVPGGGE